MLAALLPGAHHKVRTVDIGGFQDTHNYVVPPELFEHSCTHGGARDDVV